MHAHKPALKARFIKRPLRLSFLDAAARQTKRKGSLGRSRSVWRDNGSFEKIAAKESRNARWAIATTVLALVIAAISWGKFIEANALRKQADDARQEPFDFIGFMLNKLAQSRCASSTR